MLPLTFALMDEWGMAYRLAMTWVKNGGIQLPDGPQYNDRVGSSRSKRQIVIH